MSEQKERVSDYRVICFGEPKVSNIVPKSGANVDKEIKVLSMRAFHPVAVRKDDGTFVEKESLWFDLKLFDDNAELLSGFLKDGLVLRVSGEIKKRTWQGKDGKEHESADLNLYSLAVDLKQRGLKGIFYEKPQIKKEG